MNTTAMSFIETKDSSKGSCAPDISLASNIYHIRLSRFEFMDPLVIFYCIKLHLSDHTTDCSARIVLSCLCTMVVRGPLFSCDPLTNCVDTTCVSFVRYVFVIQSLASNVICILCDCQGHLIQIRPLLIKWKYFFSLEFFSLWDQVRTFQGRIKDNSKCDKIFLIRNFKVKKIT